MDVLAARLNNKVAPNSSEYFDRLELEELLTELERANKVTTRERQTGGGGGGIAIATATTVGGGAVWGVFVRVCVALREWASQLRLAKYAQIVVAAYTTQRRQRAIKAFLCDILFDWCVLFEALAKQNMITFFSVMIKI